MRVSEREAPRDRPPARKDVLLFDLVGTLVDEASDYEALDGAMEAARLRFRVKASAGELSGDFTLALMEILRAEPEASDGPAEFVPFERAAKDIFAAVLEVRGIHAGPDDVAWFWDTFVQTQRQCVRPHADALTTLSWARRQGYRVFVITDADPYFVRDILPATGLTKHIDGVVTAAEAGEPKPSPALFRRALDAAGVPPVGAIMVGDSYERDVLGARNAGVTRAVLLDRHRARTVTDVPVVPTLADLPGALSRLANGLN